MCVTRREPLVGLLAPLLLAACTEAPESGGAAAQVPRVVQAEADLSIAGEWPSYNRDLAGTRYSPLTEITTANVRRLARAWSYALPRHPSSGSLSGGYELTPIVVDGMMYVAAADRVVALRPESGAEIWRFPMDRDAPSRRGVTYWPGDTQTRARLFFTAGRRLIALDAGTGRKAPGFGMGGEVEMPVVYNSAPTRFENLLVVGSNGPPGSVRAFDARTGAQVWVFDSVPGFSMTVDIDRAILYAVFESPGPDDYYGGNRPGDTLFGNSIVALDVRSGKRKWHFQTVHHDLWDYDLPAPPGLLDVTIGEATVPVLAQVTKQGYMFILNRVTGEPVFGVEERAVPQSDVPGERSSPTQPIPVKPAPLARVSYDDADLVTAADTNEQHAQFCRELRDRSGGFVNEGPFTPYVYRPPGAEPRSTLLFPGSIGGANWGGTASDPTLGYVFVNTMNEGSIGWIEPSEQPPDAYRRMSAVGGPLSRFWWNDASADSGGNELGGSERAWPCQKPPWGQLLAVDVATGEIAWQVPLGITEQLPAGKQRTGRLSMGGPIATAGGLVFIGATNDRRFRAFASRSGEQLWVAELELSAHAVPITYLGGDGKQYVAIVSGGAAAIDNPDTPDAQALVAFALP
jgi:quinoprotein glucose dehydrogenase